MAQACVTPTVRSRAPDSPETATGAVLGVVVPLPSCPEPFPPQHLTSPPTMAQVKLFPDSTRVAGPVSPATATGTGLETVVPFPS